MPGKGGTDPTQVSPTSPRATALREAGFRGTLRAECPLADVTTWRIGGPAELLATPLDRDDILAAVNWARASGVPWRVLGHGSNLLVGDDGVRGLILHMRRALDEVRIDEETLYVGAGAPLPAVANRAAREGLSGLEFGAGIPGTVGGALIMNAGWHEHEIGRVVTWVERLSAGGQFERLDGAACAFRYRGSGLRDGGGVLLGARLDLLRGDPAEILARMDTYAASRRSHQPTEWPSCGSVFLKPPGDFAGRLIEAAGLKGLRVGDVEVSTKHANFFINRGHATAADVLNLVERVEHEVEERFGVRLVREFEVW